MPNDNHDGSIASRVEDWIIAQLLAIQFNGQPAFETADVLAWEGTDVGTVNRFAEEFHQGARDRIARVLFLNDRTIELSDGQIQVVPTYVIIIGIKERTPGAIRRGSQRDPLDDATKAWGTNVMRDLLKDKFNQQGPAIGDGATYTDQAHYLGAELTFHSKNMCIMKAEVTVDEVPVAT